MGGIWYSAVYLPTSGLKLQALLMFADWRALVQDLCIALGNLGMQGHKGRIHVLGWPRLMLKGAVVIHTANQARAVVAVLLANAGGDITDCKSGKLGSTPGRASIKQERI